MNALLGSKIRKIVLLLHIIDLQKRMQEQLFSYQNFIKTCLRASNTINSTNIHSNNNTNKNNQNYAYLDRTTPSLTAGNNSINYLHTL